MKLCDYSVKLCVTFFLILLIPFSGKSQSLPVGTPVLEDYYRRAQLLGQVDSTVSFTVRPLYPVKALKIKNYLDPLEQKQKPSDQVSFLGKFGQIQVLPINWKQQFNTAYPYSINDGAMIPARGYQTLMSGGFFVKLGPLSIQLQPELVFAENKPFDTFVKFHSGDAVVEYYRFKSNIDLPEYFPGIPYKKYFWGQSSIRLTVGPISAGISSENLWWGPGIYNSLMMTNSAAGFEHFTINTVKPVKTPIGFFEGQIIGGRLDPSGFFGADTNFVVNGIRLYQPKRNDWRYLNGMVFTYHPRCISGLFLGLTRSFMMYHRDLQGNLKEYFPIFTTVDKKSNYGEAERPIEGDQLASVFARWLLKKEHAELYFEYGREDFAYNLRDFIIQPDHTRAYILGFSKLYPLKTTSGGFIQINIELTQLEVNMTNYPRAGSYVWYSHSAGLLYGYTNEGQLVGASIGSGSNLQTISLSWGKGIKTVGLKMERYVHNNDLFYRTIKDIRSNWVDINVTAFGEYNYKNILFSVKTELIRSLNYEYNYQPISDVGQFWVPGRDRYNFQAQVNMVYRF